VWLDNERGMVRVLGDWLVDFWGPWCQGEAGVGWLEELILWWR
jgi:hypothetical protein